MQQLPQPKANNHLSLSSDDNIEIIIGVGQPIENKSTLSSYITYPIKGKDKEGQFDINRRYSDFVAVRFTMVSGWPGCYIPPLPPKKLLGNGQTKFIEGRKYDLDYFCQQLTKLKYLWYSSEFQTFLRSNGDIEKNLKAISNYDAKEIVKKYEEKLDLLKGKATDTIILSKILTFHKYLKNVIPTLQNLRQIIQSYLLVRVTNNQQYGVLLNYLLPEYQKNCLAEYVGHLTQGKFILADPTNSKITNSINKLKQLINRKDFDRMLWVIDLEIRQVEGFLEQYKILQSYQNKLKDFKQKQKQLSVDQQKLALGKTSIFKSIFKSNIEDQKREVEASIASNKQNIQYHTFLVQLINIVIGYFQIDSFKQKKAKQYFKIIENIAKLEQQITSVRRQFFQNLLENHNLM